MLEYCQLEYGWQEDLAADVKRAVESFANKAHAQLLSWVADLYPAIHSADLQRALCSVPPQGLCVQLRPGW
jgi:hypothetical protein